MIGRKRGQGFSIGDSLHLTVQILTPEKVVVQLRQAGRATRTTELVAGDQLALADRVSITIQELDQTWARIGIDAPHDIKVIRDEIRPAHHATAEDVA